MSLLEEAIARAKEEPLSEQIEKAIIGLQGLNQKGLRHTAEMMVYSRSFLVLMGLAEDFEEFAGRLRKSAPNIEAKK